MLKARRKSSSALSNRTKQTEEQTATVTPCRASANQSNDARGRMLAEMKLLFFRRHVQQSSECIA